jgi:hypothetical protein
MKKNTKFFISTLSTIILTAPALVVLAESPKNFQEVVNLIIGGIFKPLVPFLIGLGVIVFIYGVLTTMLSDGEKKEDGKKYMMWGIIGIFVMVSVWGLVAILSSTFNLDNSVKTIQMTVPPGIK